MKQQTWTIPGIALCTRADAPIKLLRNRRELFEYVKRVHGAPDDVTLEDTFEVYGLSLLPCTVTIELDYDKIVQDPEIRDERIGVDLFSILPDGTDLVNSGFPDDE